MRCSGREEDDDSDAEWVESGPVRRSRPRFAVVRRLRGRERVRRRRRTGHHGGVVGRPVRTQPGHGVFRAVHEEHGHPGRHRALRRRARRNQEAGGRGRRCRLGPRRHDDGGQRGRLPAGAARAHRPCVAASRARRHSGLPRLHRRGVHRVRGRADRLRHGGRLQPRRVSGGTSGSGERHLRCPPVSGEEGAAEESRGEPRVGAQYDVSHGVAPCPAIRRGKAGYDASANPPSACEGAPR